MLTNTLVKDVQANPKKSQNYKYQVYQQTKTPFSRPLLLRHYLRHHKYTFREQYSTRAASLTFKYFLRIFLVDLSSLNFYCSCISIVVIYRASLGSPQLYYVLLPKTGSWLNISMEPSSIGPIPSMQPSPENGSSCEVRSGCRICTALQTSLFT